jgi:hypothetical protein
MELSTLLLHGWGHHGEVQNYMNNKKRFDSYSKTFLNYDEIERLTKSIFISIVSYNDENILRTVSSIILNSKRPENVFIGLAVVDAEESCIKTLLEISDKNRNLNVYVVNDRTTYGYLKDKADAFYNKEDYYMSVSSRSEFDPYWDDILIKQYDAFETITSPQPLLITGDPRGWLPHDNVVEGYVYFTNHKTKSSMQREKNDSSYLPISGYHEHIKKEHLENNFSSSMNEYDISRYLTELSECSEFLKESGFVKFSKRKFLDDEFVARSLGLSCNFIFTRAKNYIKANTINNNLIDEEDFNFNSMINLLSNEYLILSTRYIPLYHLYDDREALSSRRKRIFEEYSPDEKLDMRSSILDRVKNFELLDDDKKLYYSVVFSTDWYAREFKLRKSHTKNNLENLINLCISMYNFSMNENSLHWNKRDK